MIATTTPTRIFCPSTGVPIERIVKSIAVFVGPAVPSQKRSRTRTWGNGGNVGATVGTTVGTPTVGAASEAAVGGVGLAAEAEGAGADLGEDDAGGGCDGAGDAGGSSSAVVSAAAAAADECTDLDGELAGADAPDSAAAAATAAAAAAAAAVNVAAVLSVEEPVVLLLGGEQRADMVRIIVQMLSLSVPSDTHRSAAQWRGNTSGTNCAFLLTSPCLLPQPAVARHFRRARKAVRLATPMECVSVFGALGMDMNMAGGGGARGMVVRLSAVRLSAACDLRLREEHNLATSSFATSSLAGSQARRNKLTLLSPLSAGYAPGSMPPLGHRGPYRVVIDQSLTSRRVALSFADLFAAQLL